MKKVNVKMKKSVIYVLIGAIFFIILGGGAFAYKHRVGIYQRIKYVFDRSQFEDKYNEKQTEFFCNNTKRLTQKKNDAQFVNYSKGYAFNVPKDVTFDFSLSPLFVDINNEDFTMRVSREWSPYDDIEGYIDHYFNRFNHDSTWRTENNISFKHGESVELKKADTYILDREDYKVGNLQDDKHDGYSFVIIRNNERPFFCITLKYFSDKAEKVNKVIENIADTFEIVPIKGEDTYNTDYRPIIPENWTEETKNLYNSLNDEQSELKWGIFTKDIYNEGINVSIPELENKLDYEFPVILSYVHFGVDFPTDFMQRNWNNGKIVELTYQITTSNNEKLMGYSPNIDIYRGVKDEEIRKFARQAKEFGHPFLFRLNNEMNSDWTSYGGVINLRDPEIFISNWQRFYKIFEEEGVNNAIWIFNPNDRNYPPCDWNNYLAYYPGNQYVQMIGITGYNTGTYYAEEMGETWRNFEDIYDAIYKEYTPFFSSFPWLITEFSSSSVGGDKAQWIRDMFACIDKYKNLKIAVWFDYADYDYREEGLSKIARPYFLAETPETLQAFKEGLHKK